MQISAATAIVVGGVRVSRAAIGGAVAYDSRPAIPAEFIQITTQPQSVAQSVANVKLLTAASQPVSTQSGSTIAAEQSGSAAFSVVAEGFGGAVPAYQWEVSSDSGQTWQVVSSATSPTLQLNGLVPADNGKQYRVVVTGGVAVRVVSAAATLGPT